MAASDLVSLPFVLLGCLFFLAGSVGMLRLPDAYSRLHATTKADNVGLGFITFGLLVHSDSLLVAGKLLLVWVLMLASSAAACHLIARCALRQGIEPWRKP
jgi:multicomponent Na+:H+ antiporter subunit G